MLPHLDHLSEFRHMIIMATLIMFPIVRLFTDPVQNHKHAEEAFG
ncbi:hypothetical protein VIBNISO65_610008 [Vibrio nigripulchritudo SO65]|nr:hypothetical protein VIBNIAM115_40008 [Vibrio nigripulchritudo AM115]CCN43832.1 hypothetical protein VIBNIFTn2_610049 [Vibrio nigripulchritudo FTn2]CCN64667.1 hypothetical protein VIBNIPon4_250049 [Vibrio nigripulchritudo POn4]CCN78440.1 hypothetical protein VIBNISO65_610008 [Vibrio nigripulchritudo SO65]